MGLVTWGSIGGWYCTAESPCAVALNDTSLYFILLSINICCMLIDWSYSTALSYWI